MAKRIYAARARSRNSADATSWPNTPRLRPRWRGGSVPNVLHSVEFEAAASISPHHDRDLLQTLDGAGVMSIDALVRLIPDHPHPLSSILAMIDVGILAMDCSAAFDGDTQLWCLDTAPRL